MSEPLEFKAEAAELAFQVAVCVARGDVERSEKACDNFLREAAAKALSCAATKIRARSELIAQHIADWLDEEANSLRTPSAPNAPR